MINISIYKKGVVKATVLFSLAAMTSCCGFLDQKGDSDFSQNEVYESTEKTQMRLNALYGALTSDRTYAQDLAVTFCNNTDIECVDGLYSGSDGRRDNLATYRGWGNYYNSSLIADSKNYDMYNELFGIVGNANYTIEGIRASNLLENGTEAEKKIMKGFLGEALTLRAVAYLDLIRLYGDVPMQFATAKDDLSNVSNAKVNRDVILDSLITHLTEAASDLPWIGEDGYTTEHVTKGYALGLKAQVALTRAGWAIRERDMGADYESEADADPVYPTQRPVQAIRDQYYMIAAEACNEIIKSNKHDLNPSFKALWAGINAAQNTYNPDSEILFQIPFGLNKSGELGYSVGIRLEHQTAEFGYTNSTGHMSLTAKLLYDYEATDARRNVTCGMITLRSTAGSNFTMSGNRVDNFIGNKPFGIPCGKWDPRNMSEDWLNVNRTAGGKFGYGINYIKMRYAQVLLMYAEAVNELDNDGVSYNGFMSKYDALTKVRERSISNSTSAKRHNTDNYSKFFNALVMENELEFAGEGVRKYELIRWNLLCEKINETRTAVIARSQKNSTGATVNWDAKLAYFYDKTNSNLIDETTYTWGQGITSKGSYDELKTCFGTENPDQVNNANYYCGGLVGCATYTPEVKNRYILPLSNQTLSAAGVENSYGYKQNQ